MIQDIETIDEFLAHRTDDVEEAVRTAAATEIMPRFRQLAAHEIDEKSGPHDLVTDADRKAEEFLTEALVKLLPGSVVVGEEAVHANPATYEAIKGEAPVWIVDPVDGTRQFVHGDPGFCTLVALAHRGVLLASWTYAPARDQLAVAVRGRGALLDGEPLRAGSPAPAVTSKWPRPTRTTRRTTRSAHSSACGRMASARARAARPDLSTSPSPGVSWTRLRSPGRPPGTTRRASCSSRRRAART